MRGYVLDTSFLSALYNTKDVNHKEAVEISKGVDASNLLIPFVVVAELANFKENERFRKLLLKEVRNIAQEIPTLDENDLETYLSFIENLPNSMTTIDSMILFVTVKYDAQLVSFDKKMMKIAKRI
ncbi:MAG TPA: PIN domain-containing protein [Candidatus Dojkabacteria bacterium]|nr:PIN domain-containing protein [Candidatus Dojkabacteria bacterium]